MKLIKDKDVFITEDPTVIRAFKQNGYVEEVAKAEAKATEKKKATK